MAEYGYDTDVETAEEAVDVEDFLEEEDDDNPFVVKKLKRFAKNIAEQMTADQRKELGQLIVDDTEADLESRSADMDERWTRWGKLYVGRPEQSKLSERAGAPNIHTPGSSVAVDHYSARAEKYLMPPGNIAKTEGTGEEDANRSWRVSKLHNVQFEKRIPRFRRTFGTGIKQSAIFGMSVLKSWWDPNTGHPCVSLIPAEDFIISYTHSGPLESAPRLTERMRMSRDQIRAGVRSGIYCSDCWDLAAEATADDADSGLEEARKEIDGWEPSTKSSDPGPMEVYEQHRGLDLNGDGLLEPYVVTVHVESKKVMRIVSREVKNPQGDVETLDFFTDIPFDYNPLGFYSLGIGAKTEGLNVLQDSIANLTLFAAMRNTFPPKFRCKSAFEVTGDREYELDEWIETKAHVEDVSKTFFIAPTVPPSPVLMNLYQEAGRQVREAVSVTPVMQGLEQPHNQAATTTKIIQQESMEPFNGSFRRMLDALSELCSKIYKLNRIYLKDEEYIEILGQTGQPEQAQWEARVAEWEKLTGALLQHIDQRMPPPPELVMALRQAEPPPDHWCTVAEDFANTADIIPTADPNLTTEQERLAQSEAALALVTQGPEQPSPRALWAAKKLRLEALRVPASVIADLLPEPQEPGPPPNLGPKEALAAILKGQPVAVLPDQDHRAYIEELKAFKQNPLWNDVLPAAKEAIDRHIQERVAALVEQEAKGGGPGPAAIPAFAGGAAPPMPPVNGATGMGGAPGVPMVPGGAGAPPPGVAVPDGEG